MTTIIKLFDEKLAKVFDQLRVSSPVVYSIIIIIVFGVGGLLGSYQGELNLPEWVFSGPVNEIVEFLTALLLSSRTKRYMGAADDTGQGANVMNIDHDD